MELLLGGDFHAGERKWPLAGQAGKFRVYLNHNIMTPEDFEVIAIRDRERTPQAPLRKRSNRIFELRISICSHIQYEAVWSDTIDTSRKR